MKRSVLNILIEAVSLVVFVTMISTGLLIKYVLPPGSGRVEKMLYAGGRREHAIDLYWGLSRHEWGEIHFWLALAFLVLLIVHLILHWNFIRAMTFGTKGRPQSLKRRLVSACVVFTIFVLLIFPWLSRRATLTRQDYLQQKGFSGSFRE